MLTVRRSQNRSRNSVTSSATIKAIIAARYRITMSRIDLV